MSCKSGQSVEGMESAGRETKVRSKTLTHFKVRAEIMPSQIGRVLDLFGPGIRLVPRSAADAVP